MCEYNENACMFSNISQHSEKIMSCTTLVLMEAVETISSYHF